MRKQKGKMERSWEGDTGGRMAREDQVKKGTHQILSHGPPENSTAGNASPRPGRMADGDCSGRPAAPTKHWAVKGELKEATGKKELKN